MVVIESIMVIANLTSLARTLFSFWNNASERNNGRLTREEALYILQELRRHDEALRARANEHRYVFVSMPTETFSPPDSNDPLIMRLRLDAEKLADLGIDVAYECMDDLYGIAIPVGDELVISFILTQQYPQQAPLVLIKENDELDQIIFDTDAWKEDIFLVDILAEIATAYYSTETPPTTSPDVPVEPLT